MVMKEKLKKLYNLKQTIKDLQEKEEKLKNEIKKELRKKPAFNLEGKVKVKEGEFEVILSKTQRISIDKDKFKKEYPTIFEQFKTVSESERLTIKKV